MTDRREMIRALARIRDRNADAAILERARELLRREAPDLVEALDDPDPGSAAALLAIFGEDDGLGSLLGAALLDEGGRVEVPLRDAWEDTRVGLRAGLMAESGAVDLADEVLANLGFEAPPVAAAVHAESGAVDVREQVREQVEPQVELGLPWERLLGAALRDEAGAVDVAGAVLGAVAEPDASLALPLAEALRHEAGAVDVTSTVLASLDIETAPVARAVEAEAGTVEITGQHSAELDGDLTLPVAAALHAEAGAIDVSAQVLAELQVQTAPVAAAVHAEAGAADVADAVMALTRPEWVSGLLDHELDAVSHRLAAAQLTPAASREMTTLAGQARELRAAVAREAGAVEPLWDAIAGELEVEAWDDSLVFEALADEAGTVDVAGAVMARVRRSAHAPTPSLPQPANRGWMLAALVSVAAAMFVVVGIGQHIPTPGPAADHALLQFADAREITVDDLSYSADAMVQVIQATGDEGDEGALIIWVDDEAVL